MLLSCSLQQCSLWLIYCKYNAALIQTWAGLWHCCLSRLSSTLKVPESILGKTAHSQIWMWHSFRWWPQYTQLTQYGLHRSAVCLAETKKMQNSEKCRTFASYLQNQGTSWCACLSACSWSRWLYVLQPSVSWGSKCESHLSGAALPVKLTLRAGLSLPSQILHFQLIVGRLIWARLREQKKKFTAFLEAFQTSLTVQADIWVVQFKKKGLKKLLTKELFSWVQIAHFQA